MRTLREPGSHDFHLLNEPVGQVVCIHQKAGNPPHNSVRGGAQPGEETTLAPKSVYSSNSGTGVREGAELSPYHFLTTTDHFQPCGLPSGGPDSWQGAWKEEVGPFYT